MTESKFAEAQNPFALKPGKEGRPVAEFRRMSGFCKATLSNRKKHSSIPALKEKNRGASASTAEIEG